MTNNESTFFNEFGDSKVLKYEELPNPTINEHELLLKMDYIGLNYADIYRRKGTYHIEQSSPYIDGYEDVGTIISIETSILDYCIGYKVLFVDVPFSNAN